jgi:hypothetical protein
MQKLNSVPDDQKQAFHYELMGVIAAESGKRQEAEDAYKKLLRKTRIGQCRSRFSSSNTSKAIGSMKQSACWTHSSKTIHLMPLSSPSEAIFTMLNRPG